MVFFGGVPEAWEFQEFHIKFLDALECAWVICAPTLTPQHLSHENQITRSLVIEVRKHPTMINTPYQVIPQFPVYHEDGEDGAIDIALVIGSDDLYLAYEAKCLNTPDSKAAQYVKEGMIDRYITGKYSGKMEIAGMVGYVFDGDMDRAEKALSKAVHREAAGLLMNPPVSPDWINHKTKTHHGRTPLPITLDHVLLSVI